MTTVFDTKVLVSADEVPLREHAFAASAKKVVPAPLVVAKDPTGLRTKAPVTSSLAAQVDFALKAKTTYRLIASVPCHFVLSTGTAPVAAVTDIYLPADTAIFVGSGQDYETLSVLKATAAVGPGLVQITEMF